MFSNFSIVSPGRTGSTLLAKVLMSDIRIVGLNELIEPLEPNLFLSPDILNIDAPYYWELLSRPRPDYIIDLWSKSPNSEVLFLPSSQQPSTLLSYCIPLLSPDSPISFFNELRYWFHNSPNLSIHKSSAEEIFHQFCQHIVQLTSAKCIFERTGGGSHMINNLSIFFRGNILLNLRNPSDILESMFKHSVFKLYSNVLQSRMNLSLSPEDRICNLLLYFTEPIVKYLKSNPTHEVPLIDYDNFCQDPYSNLAYIYENLIHLPFDSSIVNSVVSSIRKPAKTETYILKSCSTSFSQRIVATFDYIYEHSFVIP